MKQYKQRMNQVATQFAQMIQTVSQNRDDKRITKEDLKNIARAAYLTVFPGVSGVPTADDHIPLGYFLECFIHCIVGVDNNKACLKWRWQFFYRTKASTNRIVNEAPKNYVTQVGGWGGEAVDSSVIYKDLNIKKGETKIIVECQLRHAGIYFSDGRLCKNVSLRETFGFWALSPRYDLTDSGKFGSLFIESVILTPKPELFDPDDPPK